jgi:hypothetical protein
MVTSPETKHPGFPNATDYHNKDTKGYFLSSYRVIGVNKRTLLRERFHLMIMSVAVII